LIQIFIFCCLVAGGEHCVALTETGRAYSWGHGSDGQLGHGDTTSQLQPKEVFVHSSIAFKYVTAGAFHTVAITKDGKLFSFGRNDHGQLGLGPPITPSDTCVTLPREVRDSGLSQLQFTALAAGNGHTVALTTLGDVYTTGWGLYGQLGHGTKEDSSLFTLVRSLASVPTTEIAAGHAHTLIRSAENQVLSFGAGSVGQCGYGIAEVAVMVPTIVRQPHSVAAWTHIGAGADHSVAVAVLHPRGAQKTGSAVVDSPTSPRSRLEDMRQYVHRSSSSGTEMKIQPRTTVSDRPRSSSFNLSTSASSTSQQSKLQKVIEAANSKIESQRQLTREVSEAVFSADIIAMAMKNDPSTPRENPPLSPSSSERTPPQSPKSIIHLTRSNKEPRSRSRSSIDDESSQELTLEGVNKKLDRLQRDVDSLRTTMKEILQHLKENPKS
jgi:hypothetical protein